MSRFIKFIRTTAIGGLLVIVPIAVILFVLAQLFYGLYSIAQKLVTELGLHYNDALIIFAIAAASLVGLCFITGLVVQTRLGKSLRSWLDRNVARRIPMYNAISGLTKRFAGVKGNEFSPVEVDIHGSGARSIGFLVETLPNERCAVFVPSAPIATVGNIYVVERSKLRRLDASVADTLAAISQWGVDSHALYGTKPDDDTL